MRSRVAFAATPGMNESATTTKSKTFQPLRKKSCGRLPCAAIRIASSTTNTPRKTCSSKASVPLCDSFMDGYVARPRTAALTRMTPTIARLKALDLASLSAFGWIDTIAHPTNPIA